MKKKIFTGVVSVSLVIMLICVGLVTEILYDYMGQKLDDELVSEAVLVEEGLETSGTEYLEKLEKNRDLSCRITLLSDEGDVLYDSSADSDKMENHMKREEVKEAVADGEGFATRTSYTLEKDMRYYARLTADNEIIRVSISHSSRMELLLDTAGMMILVLLVLVGLGVLISYRVSRAIIQPINDIDLDHPDIKESYDELSPLLHRISQQNQSIREQMEKLRNSREEFNIITENMGEGLIIIDKDAEILTYNSGALRMLSDAAVGQTSASPVGIVEEGETDATGAGTASNFAEAGGKVIEGSVLKLNRSRPFRDAVNKALAGEHNRTHFGNDYFTCELIASPVKDGKQITGAILILIDVTEVERAEQMRREFTSNVSHELKTPLTSIYGVSDMLASGLVKPEDVKGFSMTIKQESSRLITLIDDIMKLSQLDESGTAPVQAEGFDLWEVAQDACMRLSKKAEENGITLQCVGTSAPMKGEAYIADEIVFNLCENAIKYNKEGGSVNVLVRNEAGRCVLAVKDTGIGIPKAEQERVFERFYRVDKSHSKKIGGTGLGLSIVKHGVAHLGGSLSLESEEGVGTTITVAFNRA